jgi:hypothetical protein
MIQIVVFLYAVDGNHRGLADYESIVAPMIREYDGQILSAFVPEHREDPRRSPDEIHILQFPGQESFDAYRNDERHEQMRERRSSVIADTEVFVSREFRDY